jgi:hypothetical protein
MTPTSFVSIIFFGALAAGCCVSRQRAWEMKRELVSRNDARADARMRGVAEARGATLLDLSPRVWTDVPSSAAMADARFAFLDYGDVGRVRDMIAYARLGRRGNTFLLFVPDVSYRSIGERAWCGDPCDDMEVSQVGAAGFDVDKIVGVDLRHVDVERVTVPLTLDFIAWRCPRRSPVWVE